MDAIALVLIMMELDQVEAWRSKPRAWETYSSWRWGSEWREYGRKPGVGVKPEAKRERASKSRKSRPPPGL